MSKKLYYVIYEYDIYGTYYTWISRQNKAVSAHKEATGYIIANDTIDLEKKIRERIDNKIQDYKQQGINYIFDFKTYNDIHFSRVLDYHSLDFKSREATVQECIENLTPTQYKEMYGDIIIGGKDE